MCIYIYIFLNQIYFSRELIFEFGEFLNVCQTLHFHKRLSQYSLSEFGVWRSTSEKTGDGNKRGGEASLIHSELVPQLPVLG